MKTSSCFEVAKSRASMRCRAVAGAQPLKCTLRPTAFCSAPAATRVGVKHQQLRLNAAAADVVDTTAEDVFEADTRLPVTIITGFLGSGKTTLLNHILNQDHGKRIAVIENEIGSIGIDQELIVGRESLDGEGDVTILENGCLCCTLREDIVVALKALVNGKNKFDHIVIETTGLANPSPIISTIFLEEELAQIVRLDGVCTVVDSKHVTKHLDRKDEEGVENEAIAQLAYADRIVLNKTDLVTPAELKRLEARVRAMNAMASILPGQHSVVPVDYVLGIGGFALEEVGNQIDKELAAAAAAAAPAHSHTHDHAEAEVDCADCGHSHAPGQHDAAAQNRHTHDHAHAASNEHAHGEHVHGEHKHGEHEHTHGAAEEEDCSDCGHSHPPGEHTHTHSPLHDDAVKSSSFIVNGEMDLDKVNYWLGALVQMRGEDIYRMKGILAIRDYPERFVFQGVHMLFEGSPERMWRENEERVSKMVFIGKDLDFVALKEGFEDCACDPVGAVAEPVGIVTVM